MAEAKKCDRCGSLYEDFPLCESELSKKWWRYSIMRDDYPYPEKRLDLCSKCRRLLFEFIKVGGDM